MRNSIDAISGLTQPAGRIYLSARRSERSSDLEISVSDNGPGVSAEVADHLFEPLTTSKERGLGLGLSICKLIVEAHGGRLWLEQHGLGATEFQFSIPFYSAMKS